jgi:hypothetical protein
MLNVSLQLRRVNIEAAYENVHHASNPVAFVGVALRGHPRQAMELTSSARTYLSLLFR